MVPSLPAWVKSRTVVLLTAATVLVVIAVVVFSYALTRGSGGQGSGTPTGPDSLVVLSVDNALAAEAGQDVKVTGFVLSTGGKTVLASALAESSPPQAAGTTLPVSGLDMKQLVGVNFGTGDLAWTDYEIVIQGVIVSGVFQARVLPLIEVATMGDLTVRFSPVNSPVSSGGQVWWAMDVINNGQSAVDLTFQDGQRGDVTFEEGETEPYRWSAGRGFTQSVQTVRLEPGKTFPVVLGDTITVPAGTYNLTASITALAGPEETAVPLPAITSTLTIH
jgi:hypothetical protein